MMPSLCRLANSLAWRMLPADGTDGEMESAMLLKVMELTYEIGPRSEKLPQCGLWLAFGTQN